MDRLSPGRAPAGEACEQRARYPERDQPEFGSPGIGSPSRDGRRDRQEGRAAQIADLGINPRRVADPL